MIMENSNHPNMNKIMLRITWIIVIGSLLWLIISNRISLIAIVGLSFPAYRYLILPIFSHEKEEYLHQMVDTLAPFATLQTFLLRKSPYPGGTIAIKIGGVFWFIILLLYNGYRSLYLDTTYRKGNLGPNIPKDSIAMQLTEKYHLADFQTKEIYELEKSDEPDDKKSLQKIINDLEQNQLMIQLNPLFGRTIATLDDVLTREKEEKKH